MGLSPMGMMGAGMAFGALSGGLQSYVGGVQQNAAFTVQSANAQLQGAQTEIAAAQALVQAEDARYQATMSDVQARQTDADRDVARVNYTVQSQFSSFNTDNGIRLLANPTPIYPSLK